ncbi:uncharacterized protein KD926_003216 [Aspergillus affinis]|uniref:uncharacterized protein n=1 Tax=Aspergillus affinis TaxID=1070780 RepID=UPI0022FE0E34|nr:uncharacterized protein KD926_003216 [Aspergillus affinis]KAI9035587.1 hypothetical protein KD926_003216 [Aspergillus affinis]
MIKRKLSGNANRFPTKESKISSTFADPNRKQQAKREYKVLKIKPGQLFKDYVAKFEALAQAAGVRRDKIKSDLYESLSASFKKLIIMYYHQSPDYNTFVQNCHLMADSLQGIETSYQLEKADRAPKGTITRTRTIPTATAVTVTGTSVPRSPVSTGRYLSITPEERLRCRIEGLCFYCREKGYMTPDCPKKTTRAQPAALKALERPENEEAGAEQDLKAKKDSV